MQILCAVLWLLASKIVSATEPNYHDVKAEIHNLQDMMKKQATEIQQLKQEMTQCHTYAKTNEKGNDDMSGTEHSNPYVYKEIQTLKIEFQELKHEMAQCRNRTDTIVKENEEKIKRLLLDGQAQTRTQVAFYAHLSKNIEHVGNHQTIIFDTVRTNQGNAYNSVDGEFLTRVAGTYFFIWTISNSDLTTMQSELVVNGNIYGQIISDAANHNDWAVSTGFTIVSLNVDDRVWIRSGEVHTGHIDGVGLGTSSFAGFLLW